MRKILVGNVEQNRWKTRGTHCALHVGPIKPINGQLLTHTHTHTSAADNPLLWSRSTGNGVTTVGAN